MMDSSFGNAMGLLQALIKKDVPLAQTYTHMILEEQEKEEQEMNLFLERLSVDEEGRL